MQQAFEFLDGDLAAMRRKKLRSLSNDLLHRSSRTMVEVDEFQHFTSMRGTTLHVVARDSVGFDLDKYQNLVATWRSRSDRYFATKVTTGFPGPLSRGRGRAYFASCAMSWLH